MAWPKGKKRNQTTEPEETAPQAAPAPVHGTETQEETVSAQEEVEASESVAEGLSEVASQDTWRYHETNEPRIFLKGEVIPPGWSQDHSAIWHRTADCGRWVKHTDIKESQCEEDT